MRALVLIGALLAGCAAMSENECRTSNWYDLGQRDALAGAQPQIEHYAEHCGHFAVKPDEQQYLAGWALGYSEWNTRVSGSRM
jgi:uncharacterized protein DUF2799